MESQNAFFIPIDDCNSVLDGSRSSSRPDDVACFLRPAAYIFVIKFGKPKCLIYTTRWLYFCTWRQQVVIKTWWCGLLFATCSIYICRKISKANMASLYHSKVHRCSDLHDEFNQKNSKCIINNTWHWRAIITLLRSHYITTLLDIKHQHIIVANTFDILQRLITCNW